ncbi:DNA-binding protein [Planomonospora algeriensis]
MNAPMSRAELLALPPVIDIVTAGRALGFGRTKSYELARTGEFPCRVIRAGRSYLVPTAVLLAVLGLEPLRPHLADVSDDSRGAHR